MGGLGTDIRAGAVLADGGGDIRCIVIGGRGVTTCPGGICDDSGIDIAGIDILGDGRGVDIRASAAVGGRDRKSVV